MKGLRKHEDDRDGVFFFNSFSHSALFPTLDLFAPISQTAPPIPSPGSRVLPSLLPATPINVSQDTSMMQLLLLESLPHIRFLWKKRSHLNALLNWFHMLTHRLRLHLTLLPLLLLLYICRVPLCV